MFFCIHADSNEKAIEMLPENTEVVNSGARWIIVKSDMTWDKMREHYKDKATVGIAESEAREREQQDG
jgi:hypothetical protein